MLETKAKTALGFTSPKTPSIDCGRRRMAGFTSTTKRRRVWRFAPRLPAPRRSDLYRKLNGKPERMRLGPWPDLTVDQARRLATSRKWTDCRREESGGQAPCGSQCSNARRAVRYVHRLADPDQGQAAEVTHHHQGLPPAVRRVPGGLAGPQAVEHHQDGNRDAAQSSSASGAGPVHGQPRAGACRGRFSTAPSTSTCTPSTRRHGCDRSRKFPASGFFMPMSFPDFGKHSKPSRATSCGTSSRLHSLLDNGEVTVWR